MFTLQETARRIGSYRWAEGRLFQVVGGWVGDAAEPEVKLALDRHSQHHAWRAEQWWDRLPILAGLDRHELVAPPDAATAALVDRLAGLEGTAGRLAGAYRVALPRLAGAYQAHLASASPAGDAAVIRTLRMSLSDLTDDWQEGEYLLQSLLTDDAALSAAFAAAHHLEAPFSGGR